MEKPGKEGAQRRGLDLPGPASILELMSGTCKVKVKLDIAIVPNLFQM